MKLVKAKYANSGADGIHCEQGPRCRFASSFFSRHIPEELTLKGHCRSASPSFVVSTLSLFFFGVIAFSRTRTRSLSHTHSPSLLFTLFISQQLHYLMTLPQPVRYECPALCCCCCCCLAAVVSRDIFLDETEHHVSVRTADSAPLMPCVFLEQVPLAARRKDGTHCFQKASTTHTLLWRQMCNVWHVYILNAQRYSGGLSTESQEQQSKEI